MTVYVDDARHPLGRMIMCHLLGDDVEELHAMAEKLGVDRHFQADHYDVCLQNRRKAIARGAKEITQREAVKIRKAFREIQRRWRDGIWAERNRLNLRLCAGDGSIVDEWIIVRQPGCAPQKKRPGAEGDGSAEAMLRALFECCPAETQLTLVRLTWSHDLWVDDGRAYLNELEAWAPPRRRKKST
jgi:hypothetical protein